MRSPASSRVRGFTLVELMVAMVLALLILAAIGGLYVSTKQTFRVQDNTSGIDEVLLITTTTTNLNIGITC